MRAHLKGYSEFDLDVEVTLGLVGTVHTQLELPTVTAACVAKAKMAKTLGSRGEVGHSEPVCVGWGCHSSGQIRTQYRQQVGTESHPHP